jgi:hypothetical protein
VAATLACQEQDTGIAQLKPLENLKKIYCKILSANGCDGSKHRRKDAPTRETYVAVMEPHSMARVKAIKDSKMCCFKLIKMACFCKQALRVSKAAILFICLGQILQARIACVQGSHRCICLGISQSLVPLSVLNIQV